MSAEVTYKHSLLPCPFCGSYDVHHEQWQEQDSSCCLTWRNEIECKGCWSNFDMSVESWNTRPDRQPEIDKDPLQRKAWITWVMEQPEIVQIRREKETLDAEIARLEANLPEDELLSWLDEECCDLVAESLSEDDGIWIVKQRGTEGESKPIGYGDDPRKAVLDAMKPANDPSKMDYCPSFPEPQLGDK